MLDFDMILAMDFISRYKVEIDYKNKKVQFQLNDDEEFTFSEGRVLSMIINSIKTRKILSKGCVGYLVHVMGKADGLVLSLQSTSVVCKFQNVFSDDLIELTPKRGVEFSIELALETKPISKVSYKMALIKL